MPYVYALVSPSKVVANDMGFQITLHRTLKDAQSEERNLKQWNRFAWRIQVWIDEPPVKPDIRPSHPACRCVLIPEPVKQVKKKKRGGA